MIASSAAMKPDTASAASMTKAHHHRDVAAATRPSTSRGTSSRQPSWRLPSCSCTIQLRPSQPRMTTNAPVTMAHTTSQASRTSGCR